MSRKGFRIGSKTWQTIIDLLKQNGRMDVKTLAECLGISQMGVRLHLYNLHKEKLVRSITEPRPLGRPTQMWQLTTAADSFFPDYHANLTVRLIETVEQTFGSEGFSRFLEALTQKKVNEYRAAIPGHASLRRRVEALADLRTAEGCMAEVQVHDDGSFLLVGNHCPICIAAANCRDLCSIEPEVFRQALGSEISVERLEHIQSGAQRCVYRIQPSGDTPE